MSNHDIFLRLISICILYKHTINFFPFFPRIFSFSVYLETYLSPKLFFEVKLFPNSIEAYIRSVKIRIPDLDEMGV